MGYLRKLIKLIVLALCLGVIRGYVISPILVGDIDWDIDQNDEITEQEKMMVKQDIIQELATPPPDCPACNRRLFPIICDNLGNRHNNICEFLCNREQNKDLTPKRILLSDPIPKDYCKIKQL